MYIQATIQCECGCVSRVEFQDGKHAYICPQCKKAMPEIAYAELEKIMCEFGDWNTEMLKDSVGYDTPKMRAVSLHRRFDALVLEWPPLRKLHFPEMDRFQGKSHHIKRGTRC